MLYAVAAFISLGVFIPTGDEGFAFCELLGAALVTAMLILIYRSRVTAIPYPTRLWVAVIVGALSFLAGIGVAIVISLPALSHK